MIVLNRCRQINQLLPSAEKGKTLLVIHSKRDWLTITAILSNQCRAPAINNERKYREMK